jgi:hypothetical protein
MQQRIESIAAFLDQEGYEPKVLAEHVLVFTWNDGDYLIQLNEQSPNMFRVARPRFWKLESPSEVLRAALATSEVCQSIYIVKVYIMDDHMWAAAEQLVGPGDEYQEMLPKLLSAIDMGVTRFAEMMRGADSDDGDEDGEEDDDDDDEDDEDDEE